MSPTPHNACVFLFHRDLRVVDNTAFNAAVHWSRSQDGGVLVPLFVLPPEQIDVGANKYFSNAAVQFMCESLKDLDTAITKLSHGTTGLVMLRADTLDALDAIRKHPNITLSDVFCNMDYSVYAKARDKTIANWCKTHDISFSGDMEDYDIVPLSQGLVQGLYPYTNLSQYFAKFTKGDLQVHEPATAVRLDRKHFIKLSPSSSRKLVTIEDLSGLYVSSPDIVQHGGQNEWSEDTLKNQEEDI